MTANQEEKRRTVDGWILVRRISRGGQARVYEAIRGEGEAVHALKLISTRAERKRARFIQEVRRHIELLASGATNIVPIVAHNLDAFEAGAPEGYIVMPRAETTLRAEIDRGLFEGRLEIALEVFRGIVRAVAYAHAARIIHRDLKPPNILFMDSSLKNPLVSDFGICFVKGTPSDDRITEIDETVGARAYMAPEQERGGIIDVTEAADVYALGKILHFMLTRRLIFREDLTDAFNAKELEADSRLMRVLDVLLAPTIMTNPEGRVQNAQALLARVDALRSELGVPKPPSAGGGTPQEQAEGGRATFQLLPSVEEQYDVQSAYRHAVTYILQQSPRGLAITLDARRNALRSYWLSLKSQIDGKPELARGAAEKLIREQTEVVGTTLAMSRLDASDQFDEFRKFLESTTRLSEGGPGYLSVISVPHVLAGFLYMVACVTALFSKSWEMLAYLLSTRFEWYYQSGRPIYSFGFDHPYFFHPEALGRNASTAHDLYRREYLRPDILDLLAADKEEAFSIYIQTQMLMSLRGAQEEEGGEDVGVWPDFGRFYAHRAVPLLDRARSDPQFAKGLLKSFDETPDEWFARLNPRLVAIQRKFRGGNFMWQSISEYEPN